MGALFSVEKGRDVVADSFWLWDGRRGGIGLIRGASPYSCESRDAEEKPPQVPDFRRSTEAE